MCCCPPPAWRRMTIMLRELRTATLLLLALTALTGGLYPLAVTVIAQVVFPQAANGSLFHVSGGRTSEAASSNRYNWTRDVKPPNASEPIPAGSKLIGQAFSKPEYFWGRLSATTPFAYNAASSSGSNFGPLNPALKVAAE